MSKPILILPGYGNSDEKHWQSIWESNHPNFTRVQQKSWDNPVCADWIDQLESAVANAGSEAVLVAHSLGCLLLAKWAEQTHLNISGALLVAVPDPEGENFPKRATGFNTLPTCKFEFPSTVVASCDDPYSKMPFTKKYADHWGAELIELGHYGHINTESGLESWQFGYDLLLRKL